MVLALKLEKRKVVDMLKKLVILDGSSIDFDILKDDPKIPNVYTIPLLRIEDIYTNDLSTGISDFIDSEEKYLELKKESKEAIKKEMKTKIDKFQNFCQKFNQKLNIEIIEPKMTNEKVYIVDDNSGEKTHNYKIGSGYKSIANIILNTLSENYNIILIDEFENHLHPSIIRTLLYSQKSGKNIDIINNWKGNKSTIRSAKGSTIECDIVIIGDKLNYKNLYTAITRSKKMFIQQ